MPLSPPAAARTASTATLAGEPCLMLGGCDYLGLAHHHIVKQALQRAIEPLGVSASASRTTTGNTLAHEKLEQRICEFTGMPDAAITPEGMLANLAICQSLARTCATALIDERAHRSLSDAAIASQMRVLHYRHLDASHARALASGLTGGVCIMTDGVFCADGAIAPVPGLLDALPDASPEAASVLVLDECHALGVIGARGRGSLEHHAITDPRICLTSTLAKAIGCYGGFAAGPSAIIERLRERSGAFVCTTPIPPALAVAAKTAFDLLSVELDLLRKLRENISACEVRLRALGLIGPEPRDPTPIFAFTLESTDAMRRLAELLRERNAILPLIQYPGGPSETYFRLSVSAAHSSEELDWFFDALEESLGSLAPSGA